MAAYRRNYDSRHLQADCQEPGSAPEPYARQSSMGYLYLFMYHDHSSLGIESRGHRSRSRIRVRIGQNGNTVGLTWILDRGQFVFPLMDEVVSCG